MLRSWTLVTNETLEVVWRMQGSNIWYGELLRFLHVYIYMYGCVWITVADIQVTHWLFICEECYFKLTHEICFGFPLLLTFSNCWFSEYFLNKKIWVLKQVIVYFLFPQISNFWYLWCLFDRMQVDSYAYLPANYKHSLESDETATIIIFERRFFRFWYPYN